MVVVVVAVVVDMDGFWIFVCPSASTFRMEWMVGMKVCLPMYPTVYVQYDMKVQRYRDLSICVCVRMSPCPWKKTD